MLFPYWETGNKALPLVPVTLYGPAHFLETLALIDSGAEQSVIGADVAARLSLPSGEGKPVTIAGVGGHHMHGEATIISMR